MQAYRAQAHYVRCLCLHFTSKQDFYVHTTLQFVNVISFQLSSYIVRHTMVLTLPNIHFATKSACFSLLVGYNI